MGWFNHHLAREISKIHGLLSTFSRTHIPGNSASLDRFGMVKKSDLFKWLSELQLGDQKVTLNHQVGKFENRFWEITKKGFYSGGIDMNKLPTHWS